MLQGNAQRQQLVLPEQLLIYDYWRSKCREGHLPSRDDIDPSDIKPQLPHVTFTSICPHSQNRRYQIRLAGTGFWKFFGAEIQGRYVDELPLGDRCEYWQRVLTQVVERRRPSAGVTRTGTPIGGHLLQFWIRLPLASNGRDVDLILGYDHFLTHNDVTQRETQQAQMRA